MEINKKSRTELKAYFVKNALPTESNFRDLIDAGLNQKDDGLVKSADQPVQIAASTAGDKPAIHLYESFATDTKPAWALSLQAAGKKGLGIGDGDGRTRLFIDGATGNVGIGTADPAGNKLRVAGNVLVDGADGAAMLVIKDGNVGIGTQDPSYKLQVNGSLSASSVDVSLGHAAACKEEVVRIVRGGVMSNGGIFAGTGFTVSKVGTGFYDITFSTPFNSRASVVATQHYPGTNDTGGDTRDNATVVVVNHDRVRIKTGGADGSAADRHFCFIAIGT
ncbi:hypothetical protein WMF30_29525 [Sorangium sp. So ce134]